jgi:hypothetical protein
MAFEIEVDSGSYRSRWVLSGEWDTSLSERLQRERPPAIDINYARGWNGKELSFLSECVWLEAISICLPNLEDISFLQPLQALKSVSLAVGRRAKLGCIFPCLEECLLEWRDGFIPFLHSNSIRKLVLSDYKRSTIDEVSRLRNLRELSIYNSNIKSLDELSGLINLSRLELALLRKWDDLQFCSSLQNLMFFDISRCSALRSIQPLSFCRRLRRLAINDMAHIDSLSPIRSLPLLEELLFYGTTHIDDGDLSFLSDMPNLCSISFQDRKHYTHTRSDLERRIVKSKATG